MYNFDPYNVLLAISTNIPAAYDCVCAPGTHMRIIESLTCWSPAPLPRRGCSWLAGSAGGCGQRGRWGSGWCPAAPAACVESESERERDVWACEWDQSAVCLSASASHPPALRLSALLQLLDAVTQHRAAPRRRHICVSHLQPAQITHRKHLQHTSTRPRYLNTS